jgi:HSP20 family protein
MLRRCNYLVEEGRLRIIPVSYVYCDNERYAIEVELPGVEKKNVEFDMTPSGFCVTGHRDGLEYSGCWTLEKEIVPKKARATFTEGLLKATAPMAKAMRRTKITIN